jgi:streptogramin lyase
MVTLSGMACLRKIKRGSVQGVKESATKPLPVRRQREEARCSTIVEEFSHLGGPLMCCHARLFAVGKVFLFISSPVVLLCTGQSARANYVFVRSVGTAGSGDGQFNEPTTLAFDSSGNIWVADQGNNRIQEFTSSGTFIKTVGTSGSGTGQFHGALLGVAVDSSGNVWVADAGNSRLQEFTSSGTFIRTVGTGGSGNGQFSQLSGIAIDPSGNIWTVEDAGARIQEFNSSGTFIKTFGTGGTGNGQFEGPQGMTVDSSGNVWVADTGSHRLQEFTSTGTFKRAVGGFGNGNGQFFDDVGMGSDSSGNVWVADHFLDRIQEFNSTGTYLTQFGISGSGTGQFNGPFGEAVDSSGNVWVADTGNNRIEEFALRGDFNRDGHVTAADISAMQLALTNPQSYESTYGVDATLLSAIGDLNGDGIVNNADLQWLLNLLNSGGGSTNPVPEPGTFVLAVFALGLLLLLEQFRHRVAFEQSSEYFPSSDG